MGSGVGETAVSKPWGWGFRYVPFGWLELATATMAGKTRPAEVKMVPPIMSGVLKRWSLFSGAEEMICILVIVYIKNAFVGAGRAPPVQDGVILDHTGWDNKIMELLFGDKRLPAGLWEIRPRVERLYVEGDLGRTHGSARTGMFDKALAVVGSRRMTSMGERVIEKWMPVLVSAGVTIVSGMMYGVDQKAHRECIECGGKTVGVLGWGIEVSKEDRVMSQILKAGGVIMSEWKNEQAQRWMFPYRNRVVVGLCSGVLVIEAGEKSGSLVTARLAQKWGRKLLAVPGPVTSSVSLGTNELIKSGKAKMVTSAEEVLEEMGWGGMSNKDRVMSQMKNDNNMVLGILVGEAMTVDELARKTGRKIEDLGVELSMLELNGKVRQRGGKWETAII